MRKFDYSKPQIAEIGSINQVINAAGYTPPTDGVITGAPGMMMILVQPTPPMS
jgi:hypothetical protein